jgi:hypothetical protein
MALLLALIAFGRRLATSPHTVPSTLAIGGRIDRRGLARLRIHCAGHLAVLGTEGVGIAVRCRDISDWGVLVTTPRPFLPGAAVVVRIPSVKLMGIGQVRHCRKRLFRYAVGIEFNSPPLRTPCGDWTVRGGAA